MRATKFAVLRKARGTNNSSRDDDQTTAAIRFLILADKAHEFQNVEIHQAVELALNSLLDAQFQNGGFPQVWNDLVERNATIIRRVKANFPDFDWRTAGRIKNYWTV